NNPMSTSQRPCGSVQHTSLQFRPMSAIGGKAGHVADLSVCPLMTHSGRGGDVSHQVSHTFAVASITSKHVGGEMNQSLRLILTSTVWFWWAAYRQRPSKSPARPERRVRPQR